MSRLTLLSFLLIGLVLAGCDPDRRGDGASPANLSGNQSPIEMHQARLFRDPIQPETFELPSQALARWRKYARQRPVLLLLADQPYLAPLAGGLTDRAIAMIHSGSAEEIARRTDYDQPDPLILAPQAVRAGLLAGLFREVVWVLPSDQSLQDFSWDVVEEQLREIGLLGAGQRLNYDGARGVAKYTVEGVPLTLVHPDGLAAIKLEQPVIFHLDLSFFKGTYRNEARMPAVQLLQTIARMLRNVSVRVLDVTLSASTLDGYVSLDGRFSLAMVEALLKNPSLLDGALPKTWQLKSEALGAITLFQERQATELYERLVQLDPDNPGALYALSQRRFYRHRFREGVALLDRAVGIDRGYAVAYLTLSDKAYAAGDLKNALILLDKAISAFPDNPSLKVRRAVLLQRSGRSAEARQEIEALVGLPWSPVYHPEIPGRLEELKRDLSPEPSGLDDFRHWKDAARRRQ